MEANLRHVSLLTASYRGILSANQDHCKGDTSQVSCTRSTLCGKSRSECEVKSNFGLYVRLDMFPSP